MPSKLCLSAFDDKRYFLPDGVPTLAHEHFRIPRENAEAKNSYYDSKFKYSVVW